MANNLSSNYTASLAKGFMAGFESDKVLCKAVNTQLLTSAIKPDTGGTVEFKRPTDYNAIRTAGGDISSETKSDIIVGKTTGEIQNWITMATEWSAVEEALELGDEEELKRILRPMATRAVTELETSFGEYMMKNCATAIGTPGTAINSWTDVAETKAYMHSLGVPRDRKLCYALNPYGETTLANLQANLAGNADSKSAWENSRIPSPIGGVMPFTTDSLPTFTTSAVSSDRAGAVNGVPTATYVDHKDTMIQSIAVDGFGANLVVQAGEVVEVTGVNQLSLATRKTFTNTSGNNVLFRGVVTETVTLNGSGAGTLAVAGPAIREANGQYNTVDVAIADNDVITLLGSEDEVRQPNLVFHPEAFGIGTVKIKKLYSTDTIATSEDGFSLRVSRYADGDANTQKVRFDMVPAFITFNPFFAAQAWG